MTDFKETSVGYISDEDYASFCSSEKKWINKMLRLHEQRPNEVEIICMPEDNEGTLFCHVPKSWLKISPPRQVNYTDEQRAAMAERLAMARNNKSV